MASSEPRGSCFTATSGDGAFADCARLGGSSGSTLMLVDVVASWSSLAKSGSLV